MCNGPAGAKKWAKMAATATLPLNIHKMRDFSVNLYCFWIFDQYKTSSMSRLPKRHFWEWFKRHNHELISLQHKTKKEAAYWLNELNAHLRAYYKFFGYSLAWNPNGENRLTITVHGKAMHFKKVDSFVATAPAIPNWSIQALEGTMPFEFMLEKEMADTGAAPQEFHFSFASDDEDDTFITLYHPMCTDYNNHLFLRLAYGALYNVLGERSYGLDITSVEVENLSNASDKATLHPLEVLPTYLGQRRSSITVDHNGMMWGIE